MNQVFSCHNGTELFVDWETVVLFVLSGNRQIGKTRWLEQLVKQLSEEGVTSYGVLAPGVWQNGAASLEKTGIDNVLLPEGTRIKLAKHRSKIAAINCDAISVADAIAATSTPHSSWVFDPVAIERVNGHLEALRKQLHGSYDAAPDKCARVTQKGVLVIDELGPLELVKNSGLVQAVGLMEDGPSENVSHAIVVVRESLLPELEGRFGKWGERLIVGPSDSDLQLVREMLLR